MNIPVVETLVGSDLSPELSASVFLRRDCLDGPTDVGVGTDRGPVIGIERAILVGDPRG